MTEKCVHVECGDGSQLIVWYNYLPTIPGSLWNPSEPAEWELVELYHERKLEGKPPQASVLTCLNAMIDAVQCYKPPFEYLYEQINEAITIAEQL
jgi:hypothetical protein